MKKRRKEKPVVQVQLFDDEFAASQENVIKHLHFPGADVRQLTNDNYLQPAFLLSVPDGKYDDGSLKHRQWVIQGCKIFLHQYGFHIKGFMPESKDMETMTTGPYRRSAWWGPLGAFR
jgi:hypothetical protein